MSLLTLLAATAGTPGGTTWPDPPVDPPPGGGGSAPPLRWDASVTVKVTQWGNSHYIQCANVQTLGTYKTLLDGAGAWRKNIAHPGATWQWLNAHLADANAEFNPIYDHNVIVVGETTNDVHGGGYDGYTARTTQAEVIADAQACIDGLRAAHPNWVIVLCGSIPIGGAPEYGPKNALTRACDDHMKANWAAMGADAYVDFRTPGGYFDGDGTSLTSDTQQWMGKVAHNCDFGAVPFVHPAGPAQVYFADRIRDGLAALATP